jgi:meiotic recombination protein SPO11
MDTLRSIDDRDDKEIVSQLQVCSTYIVTRVIYVSFICVYYILQMLSCFLISRIAEVHTATATLAPGAKASADHGVHLTYYPLSELVRFSKEDGQYVVSSNDGRDSSTDHKFGAVSPSTIKLSLKNSKEWAALLNTAATAHKCLLTKLSITKRDMFYQNVKVYGSQRYSDSSIELLSALLHTPRQHLNIVAAPKGRVVGNLQYQTAPDTPIIDCTRPQSIADDVQWSADTTRLRLDVDFVLVVEKETVFFRLQQLAYAARHRCLLVTGKGMPDLATRKLLKALSVYYPALPFYALVDCDPWGVSIFMTYKFGAPTNALALHLAVSRLQLLGVHTHHFAHLPPQTRERLFLKTTDQDKKKLTSIYQSEAYDALDVDTKRSLGDMQEARIKAEIEAIDFVGVVLAKIALPRAAFSRGAP